MLASDQTESVPAADSTLQPASAPISAATDQQRAQEEWLAMRHVRKLGRFYRQLVLYVTIITVLVVINAFTQRHYWWVVWPAFGWGLGLLFQANALFRWVPCLGADWERRQVEKRLSRPL